MKVPPAGPAAVLVAPHPDPLPCVAPPPVCLTPPPCALLSSLSSSYTWSSPSSLVPRVHWREPDKPPNENIQYLDRDLSPQLLCSVRESSDDPPIFRSYNNGNLLIFHIRQRKKKRKKQRELFNTVTCRVLFPSPSPLPHCRPGSPS